MYHPPPIMLQMVVLSVAVIIAGRPATGKSSALDTVVSTLNAVQGSASSNIKLVKIYPDTYESLSELYGCVSSPGGEWVDGIFTSAFRKAHKVSRLGSGAITTNAGIHAMVPAASPCSLVIFCTY